MIEMTLKRSSNTPLWSLLLVVVVLLILVVWIRSYRRKPYDGVSSTTTFTIRWPIVENNEGTQVVWEKPKLNPKGVVFLAHGCSHSATDFWDKSPNCPSCIGLPEDKALRQGLINSGYAVIAISSQDREGSKCWNPEDDIDPVKNGLKSLIQRERMDQLPIYGIGISSGGGFVTFLSQSFKFDAIEVQIMGTLDEMISKSFPPTLFTHMPRDSRMANIIHKNMETLKSHAVRSAEIKVHPMPLSPDFFSNRVPEISPPLSAAIYKALVNASYLNEKGFLIEDPRGTKWREVLRKSIPELKDTNMKPDESAIPEVMNVAYARHEIVARFMNERLQWFETKGNVDISKWK
eukprot:NODE_4362_length_1179_cov_53.969697_g3853_i0.p1 GENE.NODE_4362_length_1179_cov_53.969697_g3853_i0~~NODE_4362_length_1179_cov_53.969697_g3853_i0.p1  ORF type:complete len:348 (+),score=65.73 NODE_4362_length_1179_cov_53.969697_g3853_i0:58-1101(+)